MREPLAMFQRDLVGRLKRVHPSHERGVATATLRDVDVVFADEWWDIYLRGPRGSARRGRQRVCRVDRDRDVLEFTAALVQLLRDERRASEAPADFAARVGIDYVRERIAKDVAGRNILFAKYMRAERRNLRPGGVSRGCPASMTVQQTAS